MLDSLSPLFHRGSFRTSSVLEVNLELVLISKELALSLKTCLHSTTNSLLIESQTLLQGLGVGLLGTN